MREEKGQVIECNASRTYRMTLYTDGRSGTLLANDSAIFEVERERLTVTLNRHRYDSNGNLESAIQINHVLTQNETHDLRNFLNAVVP